ncbi:MAG: hypothetical protein CMJ34_00245 [Phycisphaerae bacterium]|nr:hypothetical protein [Phycisphaerae bacterium]
MDPASPEAATRTGTRSTLSIAITYPVVLSFVMGLVVLLMGALTTAGMQRSTRDLLDQLIHQVTERMRLAVVDTLETPHRVAGLMSESISSGRLEVSDISDLEACIPQAAEIARAFPSIGSVLVANARDDVMWVEQRTEGDWKVVTYDDSGDGNAVERLLDDRGLPTGESLGSYPYTPSERPWYRTAVEAGEKGAWSPLYVWATTDETPPIGAGFAREITNEDGNRLALIEIGFTTRDLSEQMGRISIGREGRAMIMDSGGNIVATDDPGIRRSMDGKVLPATAVDDPVLAGVAGSAIAEGGGATYNTRVEQPSGTWWEAESEPLAIDWGPTWNLVIAIPDRELLSGVRQVQSRMLLAGVLILIGCGLIGFAVARSIVRPILALRGTAAAIAGGNLEATFDPRGGREFIELSRDLSSMTSGLRERFEMQNALEVAMEIQQHLLPQSSPLIDGVDIAATSIYSDETGGDYFDFPEADPGTDAENPCQLIALGDVTGHGIGAALIMASARSALRARLHVDADLGTLLGGVNATLVEDIPMGRFMTMLFIRLKPELDGFLWASAGHDPPIVYDPLRDTFHEPDGGSVPLGLVDDEHFDQYEEPLHGPGSIIVTATDGVWETVSPDGDFYGKDRLRELIHRHRDRSSREIMDAVIEDTNRFRGHDRAADDVTIVVVKLT